MPREHCYSALPSVHQWLHLDGGGDKLGLDGGSLFMGKETWWYKVSRAQHNYKGLEFGTSYYLRFMPEPASVIIEPLVLC